jgi:hypothetical protein
VHVFMHAKLAALYFTLAESRDLAAKRVDAIVKSGVAEFEDDTDAAQDKPYMVSFP